MIGRDGDRVDGWGTSPSAGGTIWSCGGSRRAERSSSEIRSNSDDGPRELELKGFIALLLKNFKSNWRRFSLRKDCRER